MFGNFGVRAGALALLPVLGAGWAQASILDGGFEGSFGGWQTFGDVSLQSDSIGISPVEGLSHALLSTLGGGSEAPYSGIPAATTFLPSFWAEDVPAPSSALHDFLGVSLYDEALRTLYPWVYGIPDGDGSGSVTGEGSAIRRIFSGEAGDRVIIAYNYATVDGGLDPAIVTLVGLDTAFELGHSLSMDLLSASAMTLCTQVDGGAQCGGSFFVDESGYRTIEMVLPHAGQYALGFGIYERGSGAGASALLIDHVRVMPVPLPAAGWLLLSGVAAVALRSRSRAGRRLSRAR